MGGELSEKMEPQKASEWLICLLEYPDDKTLRASFARWFNMHPDHARDWEKVLNAYKLMGSIPPKLEADWQQAPKAEPEKIYVASNDNDKRLSKRIWTTTISIAACLMLAVFMGEDIYNPAEYATGLAEVKEINLPDGSIIHLAPESRLNTNFTDEKRSIELVEGQAFFDVAHNVEKPFFVHAENSMIRVVGTAFDVSTRQPSVSVKVKEGIVAVKPDHNEEILLKVGDTIRVTSDYATILGKTDPKYISSWSNNQLVVNDRPVSEVIETLSHYHSSTLLVIGDDIGNQPVTGVYQLTNPDIALSAIAQSVGAKAYKITPFITVISDI